MKQQKIAIASCLLFLIVLVTIQPQAVEAAATYADGEYSVPFEVYKDTTDEISATSDYMVSPAKLVIEKGKVHAIVTLNNGSWWQYFRTESAQSGSFSEVKVVSEDSEKDKKIVQFEVSDIEKPLNAKIHIIVTGIPGFEYDNKYDIRLKLDYKGLPIAQELSKNEPEVVAPDAKSDGKLDAKPDAKPVDKPDAVSKPEPQLQPEQAVKPKPTPEESTPNSSSEKVLESELEAEPDSNAEEANPEPMDAGLGEEAPDGTSDGATEAISGQTEEPAAGIDTTESVKDSNTPGTNKVALYSLLAIGLLVLLFFIIRARKHKK